jgi:hypothetical protein
MEDDELDVDEDEVLSDLVGSSFPLMRSSTSSTLSHTPVLGTHLGRRLDGEDDKGEAEGGERDSKQRNSGEDVQRELIEASSSLSRSSPSHLVGDDVDEDVDVDEEEEVVGGSEGEGPRRERRSGLGEGMEREGKVICSNTSHTHFTLFLITLLLNLFLFCSSDDGLDDDEEGRGKEERRILAVMKCLSVLRLRQILMSSLRVGILSPSKDLEAFRSDGTKDISS